MQTKYDYSEQFKDRLKALPLWAILLGIVFVLNKGIWTLDKVIVTYVFVAFVPIKFFAIVFRSLQLWFRENKKISLLFVFLLILVSAFIFDFETVPKLLAYGLGVETQGNVADFVITIKSHFVVYEFSVNNVVFKKQQIVSMSYFKTLKIGATVTINYLQNNPKVSFLADLDNLKFETMGTLFLGFGMLASLYANEIKDKITLVINRGLHSIKPA